MRSYIKLVEISQPSSKLFVAKMSDVSDAIKSDPDIGVEKWYYLMPHKTLLLYLLNKSNTITNQYQVSDLESFWINHIGRRAYKPFLN
jgi:hypothetical protein